MSATVAALGDRNPAVVTHREADAAIALAPAGVDIAWVSSSGARVEGFDGIWVMPGTPYRDEAAVMAAIRFAREEGVPILGTCGGFQQMAVELARNVAGIEDAGHTETEPGSPEPVIHGLGCSLVGEERTVTPVAGTRFASIRGTDPFAGFHYCNYGLNERYLPRLEEAGMVAAARADDAGIEAFELPGHPFYLATLFQPQMGSSSASELSPILAAFLDAAVERSRVAGAGPTSA
jgi:CTP synthase (UTP-ammonia lyase)